MDQIHECITRVLGLLFDSSTQRLNEQCYLRKYYFNKECDILHVRIDDIDLSKDITITPLRGNTAGPVGQSSISVNTFVKIKIL